MIVTTVHQRDALAVTDHRCSWGPADRPFAEQHTGHCLAYVRSGGFSYRPGAGAFDLAPGAVMAGHPGQDFVCAHDHVRGDRCLCFRFAPGLAEEAAAGGNAFRAGAFAPDPALMVWGERAAAAARLGEPMALEQSALAFAARAGALASGRARRPVALSARDRRRAVQASAFIEHQCAEPLDLQAASACVGLSPFHFLRLFRTALGVTPHQYLVACRLRLAARRLTEEPEIPVSAIAYEVGFGDLSNFIRSFHRAAGAPPSRWRRLPRGERGLQLAA